MLRLILVFFIALVYAQEGDLYVLDLLDSGLKGESVQDTQGRLLREQNIKIIEHLGDHRYLYLMQRPSSVTRNRALIEERKHVRHKFKFKYDVKGYNGLFIVAASIPAVDVLHKLIQASPRHRHQIYSISEDDHQTPPYYASPFVLRLKDPAYLNETIYQLTNLPCVLWFDLHRKHYKKDLFAQSVLLGKVNSIPPYVLPNPEVYNFPYKGKSQIVTVADTGIDLTHCAFKRKGIPDPTVLKLTLTTSNSRALMQRFILASSFTQKIVGYLKVSFSDGTETYQTDFTDGPNGHGTHVTGLAAGASSECVQGGEGTNLIRPFSEANIFFLDLENSNSSSQHLIVPPLITPFMDVSYQTGSRVFTNSWGAATCEYTVYAMEMDRFIYFHEDYVILVAAGNEGGAAYSVSSPGILKNGITVGSSQNTRESYLAYSKHNAFWEGAGGSDLSSADVLSKSYSEHNLADFSSRGPACDDRIKPDVVCPGEFLLSSRSQGKFPWLMMRGTSMATPLCAWAVTVVVEYFQQVHRVIHPSTALVKCALITTATDLKGTAQDLRRQALDGKVSSFRTKGSLDLYDQGFGRVNLKTILEGGIGFKEGSLTSYNTPPHKYCFTVQKTDEVSIGLAWSDPPAFVHSQHTLINDLDLTVVWNNNITYYGNMGWDTDNTNNVERVRVHVEEDDYIEVYVSGPRSPLVHLRPKTSQGYALVYSSFMSPTPCKQTCDLNSPAYYASQNEVFPCKNNTTTTTSTYSTTKHLLLDEHTIEVKNSPPCCFRHVPCEIDSKKGIQTCNPGTCTLSQCTPEYKIVLYPQLHHIKKRGVSRFLTALQDATTGGINLGFWGVIVGTAEVYLLVYFFLLRR